MTGHQLLATSTEAGKCGGTKRDKALYAQHDAGLKDSWRRLLNITHRDKTAYAQHDQRIGVCSRPQLTRLFTHSMAGDCRGRRECRLVASASVIVLSINTLFCACCQTLCLAVGGTLEVSCRAVRLNETGIVMIFARSGARR